MASSVVADRLSTLCQTLWRQRALVEVLLYRLEVQQMVLAAGRSRWIDMSASDVEEAIEGLRAEELVRATSVAAVAPLLKVPETASLTELAVVAGEPWNQILRDHQAAFLSLIVSVEAVSRNNRELLNHGLREEEGDSMSSTFQLRNAVAQAFEPGDLDTARSGLDAVDDTDMVEALITLQAREMAYQGALAVTAKVVQTTLLDFLR